MARSAVGCCVLLLCAGRAPALDQPAPVEERVLREAAAKSQRLVQQSQRVWYGKAACTSCHHQILPIIVHAAARDRGVVSDEARAREVTARTFAHLKDFDALVHGCDYIDDVDEAWKLVAAGAAGVPPNLSTAAAAHYLAAAQRPDGGWHTLDGRPPQSHGRFTTSALCARAVRLYLPDAPPDRKRAVLDRARAWLLRARPRSTEDRAFQLLGLLWTGATRDERGRVAAPLLAEQRGDGGWAQLPHLASDAYSTGEALYALHQAAGLAADAPAYQRGLRFLLRAQAADGSWRVESRLHPALPVSPDFFSAGFPHGRRHQYISIMGTAWATLALPQAVGRPSDGKPAPALPDFAPAEKGEWAHVALNGSAADLRRALGAGLSPNAKTARGTTALMLAARDLEKVQLLLDRGADVHARADSGVTALAVAARYHGNSDVVRLLLARGAGPNAPQGVRVKNNASPLFFAAAGGDLGAARALAEAGAAVDGEMLVLGNIRQTPLIAATLRGDGAMVRLLIRRGADPNWGNAGKITPLHRAVINNHLEAVRALLAGGARVGQADGEGFTALHYAAAVDYGDTAVLRHLLAAGADRAAKDEQGRTALDLAREHKHAANAAVLAATDPPP